MFSVIAPVLEANLCMRHSVWRPYQNDTNRNTDRRRVDEVRREDDDLSRVQDSVETYE